MTRNNLRFIDLLVLVAVEQHPGAIYTQLSPLVNQLRRDQVIPVNYAPPLSSGMNELAKTMRTLLALGLVERGARRRGFYATEMATSLFKSLGEDWRAWPLVMPIRNQQLMLGEGIFARDFRGVL